MSEVELRNLTKVFSDEGGNVVAVDDLNIEIKDGEFLVLVGPSGCGKSTTLRNVAGLETVTNGEILLDGEEITDRKPKNRNIAMVFQSYALYPHMTARENMAFGLRMNSDLSQDEISEQVEETASMMGIESLLNSTPGELSGGQQQRVALGRAIVREPEVFLMDEPLSNLDAKLRTTMRTELQELQQRLDVTTIYVTHNQTEAMTMGDRIAILNGGTLQQIGAPLKCYNSPANQFVAGFIGSPSMNFLSVEQSENSLVHDEFKYQLSSGMVDKIDSSSGDEITLGIRPTDIQPARSENANPITVTVDVTEPIGDTSYIYFELGETACTASIPENLRVTPGEQLTIEFPKEYVYLFDSTSGKSIKTREIPEKSNSEWQSADRGMGI